MTTDQVSTKRNRSGRVATAVAIVFAISGVALIGVAIASQQEAAQPAHRASAVAYTVHASGSSLDKAISLATSEPGPSDIVGSILPRSKPVVLKIPSIGVDSEIQDLGRTAEGALETPAVGPRYNDAAWYRHSPTPGSLGPAILLGHVDSALEGPSVFFRLGELEADDRISITRADGSVAIFVVDEVHTYAKDNFPTGLVYGDIDHAGLRILTCGGAFDDATGHYLDNVVVFASLVSSD